VSLTLFLDRGAHRASDSTGAEEDKELGALVEELLEREARR